MAIEAVGGLADLDEVAVGTHVDRGARQVMRTDDERLGVVVRLFALLTGGERLYARRDAMGIGLHRRGREAIWKQYAGPPPLPADPDESERFLARYRVRRRDVQDAIDQMLGKDPEQHRPPRLSWQTLVERLAEDGLHVTEQQLIDLPFRYEFSSRLEAELNS